MARKVVPLYGIAMQQAAEGGDLEEMKALAERAERHLAADGDVAGALETLKAEIEKAEGRKR